ncbi:hypothetical protein ZEAMMB73_Zm00001d021217, partial [Zea mays]
MALAASHHGLLPFAPAATPTPSRGHLRFRAARPLPRPARRICCQSINSANVLGASSTTSDEAIPVPVVQIDQDSDRDATIVQLSFGDHSGILLDTFLSYLPIIFPDIHCFPDSFKAINDEGMSMYQRPFMKGKLYIHFSVEFPDSLSLEQCKALEAVLPPKPVSQYTDMELDECEDTMPYDVNIKEEMRRRQQQHQEAYDEETMCQA